MRRAATVLAVAVAMTAAAGGSAGASHLDDPPDPREPIDDPIPGHIDDGRIQLELQTLAEGLTAPNWGTWAPGDPGHLYVVDQDGPLWRVDLASGAKQVVLDTASLLVPLILAADERGFLGAAFHPDFATRGAPGEGLVYTMTSEPGPGAPGLPDSEPNHFARLREWRLGEAMRAGVLPDPRASRVVLEILEPQFNHNGGAIFFGSRPAERHLLYITSGDGGCADDQHRQQGLAGEGACISHEGVGNAQRLDTLLGKILRIDPLAGDPYAPAGAANLPEGALPEIFAYGFRNPFRASTDRFDLHGSGAVWTADVGQNHVEEVDVVEPGGNHGWRVKEGSFLFNPNGLALEGFASDGYVWARAAGAPAGLVTQVPGNPAPPLDVVDPIAEYDHDEGVAAIGGFVYRGSALPELYGRYVFGDYSDGFNSGNGRVMYVVPEDGADPHDRTPRVFNLVDGHINLFVLGIGEDAAGELYVLANKTGGPDGDTGVVLQLVRACAPDADCRD